MALTDTAIFEKGAKAGLGEFMGFDKVELGRELRRFARAIESAATAPLMERIAALTAKVEHLGVSRLYWKDAALATVAQVEQAAQPVAERWHVGDSAFESWYDQYLLDAPVHQGAKQKARDAYAAGMGERAATAPPKAVPLTDEQAKAIAGEIFPMSQLDSAAAYHARLCGVYGIGTPATVEKGETP